MERGKRLSSAKMTGPTLIPSHVTYMRLGKQLAISQFKGSDPIRKRMLDRDHPILTLSL
jgi:hypothetical protein